MNRTELLAYLKGLAGTGSTLSGQHLDESDPQGSYDALIRPLPDVPALLGGSPRVGQADDLSPNETLFSIMRDHATKGGIVLLETHYANPWADPSQQHIGSAWYSGPKQDLTPLAQPSGVTPQYLSFWAQVDRFVDLIKTLPDNTRLIIRQLHEANGGHFWWGVNTDNIHDGKDQQQIRLLTTLRNYINGKIKQNPLWMHCGASASWYAPCDYGRPDWVDLVGATMYDNDLAWLHPEDLTSLKSTGKPILLAECDADVNKPQSGDWDTTKYLNLDQSIVGWQAWQGFTNDPKNGYLHLGLTENQNWQSLYANNSTITRSKLPALTPVPSPPPSPVPPVPTPTPPPVNTQVGSSVPNPWPRFLNRGLFHMLF